MILLDAVVVGWMIQQEVVSLMESVQYAGCQMCRGHSENGTWHDAGVRKCHSAFLEAYTFGDDQVRFETPFLGRTLFASSKSCSCLMPQVLNALGLRHLSMETHLVRANVGSELFQRHQRMTRCLPSFLVIGTQKGGTSSFHWLLKEGWHNRIQVGSTRAPIPTQAVTWYRCRYR